MGISAPILISGKVLAEITFASFCPRYCQNDFRLALPGEHAYHHLGRIICTTQIIVAFAILDHLCNQCVSAMLL